MSWTLYLLLASSQAIAQSAFELIDGESILADCAASDQCGDSTMSGLETLLTTQSFALQHLPAGSSATRSTSPGPMFEWGFDLLLHKPPTSDEPVPFPLAPRLAVGAIKKQEVAKERSIRTGFGAYLIPPLTVAQTSIFSSGVNISFSQSPDASPIGVGAGLTYSLTRVSGAFIDGPQGLAAINALPPTFDLSDYTPTCSEEPCLDILVMHSLAPTLALSIEPHPVVSTHLQLGAAWYQHEITIGFEESRWQQLGAHPQWQAGISLRPAPVFQVGLTVGGLWRTGELEEGQPAFLKKFQVAISHHWAARRADEAASSE